MSVAGRSMVVHCAADGRCDVHGAVVTPHEEQADSSSPVRHIEVL
jgi:hypothetical protein